MPDTLIACLHVIVITILPSEHRTLVDDVPAMAYGLSGEGQWQTHSYLPHRFSRSRPGHRSVTATGEMGPAERCNAKGLLFAHLSPITEHVRVWRPCFRFSICFDDPMPCQADHKHSLFIATLRFFIFCQVTNAFGTISSVQTAPGMILTRVASQSGYSEPVARLQELHSSPSIIADCKLWTCRVRHQAGELQRAGGWGFFIGLVCLLEAAQSSSNVSGRAYSTHANIFRLPCVQNHPLSRYQRRG